MREHARAVRPMLSQRRCLFPEIERPGAERRTVLARLCDGSCGGTARGPGDPVRGLSRYVGLA